MAFFVGKYFIGQHSLSFKLTTILKQISISVVLILVLIFEKEDFYSRDSPKGFLSANLNYLNFCLFSHDRKLNYN